MAEEQSWHQRNPYLRTKGTISERTMLHHLLPFVMLLLPISGWAQRTISSSGGEGSGPGGTVSYTVGQVDFTSWTTESGSVAQGVQQPYEWLVTDVPDEDRPEILLDAWPNPTVEGITLSWSQAPTEPMSYRLMAANGDLVCEGRISGLSVHIPMQHLGAGNYVVQLRAMDVVRSSLSIIKQ